MITIKKIEYYLFALAGLATFYLPFQVTFILSLIGFLLPIIKKGFPNYQRNVLLLPFLLIILGLINSYRNSGYLVIKDVGYFINPIITMGFGFAFAYYVGIKQFLRLVFFISLILGFAYLVTFNFSNQFASVQAMKDVNGQASYFVIFGLFILLFYKRILQFKKYSSPILILSFMVLLIVSFITKSRTFIAIFILLILFARGNFSLGKYFILKLVSLILVLSVIIISILSINTNDSSGFIGKFGNTFQEITPSDYNSMSEINNDWRGYETYRGLMQIEKGNLFNWIVGQGFGQTAPLGITITLGGTAFNAIPKFHNGYITLLLKTGVFGVLVYVVFLLKIFFNNIKRDTKDNKVVNGFLVAIPLILIFTTFIIGGWLNPSSMFPFIFSLGYFLNLKHLDKKGRGFYPYQK